MFIHWDGLNSTDVVRLLRLPWNIIVRFDAFFFVSVDQHAYKQALERIHKSDVVEKVCVCALIGLPAFGDLFIWLLRGVQDRSYLLFNIELFASAPA